MSIAAHSSSPTDRHDGAVLVLATRFEPMGTSHLLMLGLFALGLVPAALLGRWVRRSGHQVAVSRAWAVVIVAVTVPLQTVDFLPGNFDLQTTLPLQLCDLALVATIVALWTRHPLAVALTYFWGLTLTTQALITPALVHDFPDPKFLGFWAMHLLIIWAAVYLIWGLRIRPTWRTYGTTVAVTVVWMISVFVFNLIADTNYGFVNRKPSTASGLDLLPAWPWYVLIEVVVVASVWALLTWPWTRSTSRTDRRSGQ